MKDVSSVPQGWKRYEVTAEELKAALGIDWPGQILSVRDEYSFTGKKFTVTMTTQPHELTAAQRERYTRDVTIPVPVTEPAPAASRRKRRWRP